MRKPRVFWKYYKGIRQGFWKVNELPQKLQAEEFDLWLKARAAVYKANCHARKDLKHWWDK